MKMKTHVDRRDLEKMLAKLADANYAQQETTIAAFKSWLDRPSDFEIDPDMLPQIEQAIQAHS